MGAEGVKEFDFDVVIDGAGVDFDGAGVDFDGIGVGDGLVKKIGLSFSF